MQYLGPCFHVIMEFMNSDEKPLLTQNCFSQEVLENNFSKTLLEDFKEKLFGEKKSRKDRQIHGKL